MNTNSFEQDRAKSLLDLEEEDPPRHGGKGRWFLLLVVSVAVGYGGYRAWASFRQAADPVVTQAGGSSGGGGRGRGGGGNRDNGRAGSRGAAVITVAAHRVDMPVYLRG